MYGRFPLTVTINLLLLSLEIERLRGVFEEIEIKEASGAICAGILSFVTVLDGILNELLDELWDIVIVSCRVEDNSDKFLD
jgi:hypothetical protein